MPGECGGTSRLLPLARALFTGFVLSHRYRYGTKLYFSSNTGSGIFEVDHASLTAVIDRTGADACDYTSSQCVPLMCPPLVRDACGAHA